MVNLPAPATADEPRVVRVFVSSTFRDMHAEREELVKRVFPQLRHTCEQRGVVWGEVDLRWGITEEEARQGQVLRLCLDEIDRCRPFFLGLLGERYGWVLQEADLAKDPELLSRYGWVGRAVREGRSVTELEIQYGVLRNPAEACGAFFYLRDPAYLTRLPAGASLADFQPEDERARLKLAALKERLLASGVSVCADYADPVTLGQRVLNDFTAFLERRFPAGEVPGPRQREADAHRTFADSRSRGYLGRQEHFHRLEAHAAQTGPPLVVFGDGGSGKSALLAKWLRHRQGEALEAAPLPFWRRVLRPTRRAGGGGAPDPFLVRCCVGATPQSTTWPALVRRVLTEIKEHFGLALDVPEQPALLHTAFVQGLALAAARGKVLLVLDGLDQLEGPAEAAALHWLPTEVPPQVRLVVTTAPGPLLTELRRRRWPTLEVKPLRRSERSQLVTTYLDRYAKRLSPAAVRDLAAAAPAANPLYLRTLLEELRVCGRHPELPEQIRRYQTAAR